MSYIRRRSLEIPADEEGMLGRECPRCFRRFTIDLERYEDRGFMNLRCPYCRFIAELDMFTTGEQRRYIFGTTQNLARRAAEEIVVDEFGGMSSRSSGNVEISVGSGSVDFGRVAIEPPTFVTEVDPTDCDECGFSYGVEIEQDGVCPVCR